MNWVTIISGAALFLAPFLLGYSGTPSALWACLILGLLIAYLGFKQNFKWAAIVGAVAFVSPWILGFSGLGGALWSCLILGGAAAVVGYLASREVQKSRNKPGDNKAA